MRYRLRTLVILTAVGPPALALVWWSWLWLNGHRPHSTLLAVFLIADATAWIIWPFLWWSELVQMVCGPDLLRPSRRKKRRMIRVRLERYCSESTYVS